jgi:hypothetical protein
MVLRSSQLSSTFAPAPAPTEPPTSTLMLATPTSPTIDSGLIRSTLYAALADVIASMPLSHPSPQSHPPRAYVSAVAVAILAVSSTAVVPMTHKFTTETEATTDEAADDGNAVFVGVRSVPLTLAKCPAPLRPALMRDFVVGREAARMEGYDTIEVVRLIS